MSLELPGGWLESHEKGVERQQCAPLPNLPLQGRGINEDSFEVTSRGGRFRSTLSYWEVRKRSSQAAGLFRAVGHILKALLVEGREKRW